MKTVINSHASSRFDLMELFRYTGLMRNLAYRDIAVRYKQTWMGVIWAVMKPFMNIAIFGVISLLINRTADPLVNFMQVGAGVIFWNLISSCISDSSSSLLSNSNLLTKVYFPKVILPVTSSVVCLIDFAISFGIYFVAFLFINGLPHWQILLLPFFILLAIVFCLSLGLFFSALNVKYRDVNFALPFILQFAFYASPVFLPTSFYMQKLPVVLQKIFLCNPAVLILDGFRYSLFGVWEVFDPFCMAVSLFVMMLMLFLGLRYFLKFEKSFADYI